MPPLPRQAAIEEALGTFGGNPSELRILIACAESPTSASEVTAEDGALSDQELGRVAYHFRAMREAGLLRITRTEQRRGAIRKVHAITARGRRLLDRLGLVPVDIPVADAQAESERRYAATKAARDGGGYEHQPDAEDWQTWTDGFDLDQAEAMATGHAYVQRFPIDGVSAAEAVAGSYVAGVVAGQIREQLRASS